MKAFVFVVFTAIFLVVTIEANVYPRPQRCFTNKRVGLTNVDSISEAKERLLHPTSSSAVCRGISPFLYFHGASKVLNCTRHKHNAGESSNVVAVTFTCYADFCCSRFALPKKSEKPAHLHTSSNNVEKKAPKGYVNIPGGRKVHKSCVNKVPNGSTVHHVNATHLKVITKEGKVHKVVPPCEHPHIVLPGTTGKDRKGADGYKAAAWTNVPHVTRMYGEWTVPSAPRGGVAAAKANQTSPSTLFFWNGIETSDGRTLIQPVLQYGQAGETFWTVSSWYLYPPHHVIATHFQEASMLVVPGDVIVGEMTRDAHGHWTIVCKKKNSATGAVLHVANGNNFDWPMNVLESYRINTCSLDNAPNNRLTFSKIAVSSAGRPVGVHWQVPTYHPTCGEKAHVFSSKRVEITWKS